ncbi:IPTL-CTERM sorting domain-containing protein [Ottowia sp. SB7-C50]|uniref:IPTL-CTERM sorting domain-containing protein n=1 Tax=Ottowia sp. SB7-C50 TaxID=3081231 RepID=UPI002954A8BC|nr:IPTL-CTERM sorting domain-containing protein [Ottowia sp. SB7-C50]WOP16601.1 IPTL-CTERM sorting domain-containing protein [Ottowia sp. SB7-C50]
MRRKAWARKAVGLGRLMLAGSVAAGALSPAVVLAQPDPPAFAIFGHPAYSYTDEDGNLIEVAAAPGIPLTCANASAAAAQMNSGNNPGMQSGSAGPEEVPLLGLPYMDLHMRGAAASLVPETETINWAAPPSGSQWIYQAWENDLDPPEYILFPVGIYVPTAADAARLRVTMRYRAKEQLIGVYRDALSSGSVLASPLTADTWSIGSTAGTVALNSGWKAGENVLTFFVQGKTDASGRMKTGFAAAFDAYCYTPSVSVSCTPANLADSANNVAVCTVSADAPALEGGLTIPLVLPAASDRYTTDCPAQVTIPAGATSAPSCKIVAAPNTVAGDGSAKATLALAAPAADAPYAVGATGSATVTVRDDDATAVSAVPTVSEWSLWLLGLLAAGAGARQLRRRR